MSSQVANRRFYLKTMQWRVGVSSVVYSWVGESTLGRSGWTRNPDPYVELVIPTASTNIIQQINTGKKLEGFIEVQDWEAIEQLLYTIDVDDDIAGTQTAIEANNTRTVIDYFALVYANIELVNVTGTHTTPNAVCVFANAVIRLVGPPDIRDPNSPYIVHFYADSVEETVA